MDNVGSIPTTMAALIKEGAGPNALEIDCARRNARGEVTHVGGPGARGRRWTARLEAVISAIERNEGRYFISRSSQQFGLRAKDGQLATMVEDGWSVRSLPACPAS